MGSWDNRARSAQEEEATTIADKKKMDYRGGQRGGGEEKRERFTFFSLTVTCMSKKLCRLIEWQRHIRMAKTPVAANRCSLSVSQVLCRRWLASRDLIIYNKLNSKLLQCTLMPLFGGPKSIFKGHTAATEKINEALLFKNHVAQGFLPETGQRMVGMKGHSL